jgi:acetyl esterase/lipase
MRKWLLGILAVAVVLVAAFALSPWPSVYIIRAIFDKGAADASDKLAPHVPAGIRTVTVRYDPANEDAVLDLHRPAQPVAGAPLVVWVHGGGFVSGRRSDLTNYAKILAGQGFDVVNVDYTIAPEAQYPTPVRQLSKALAFLTAEGSNLGIDPSRIVLAGDSAGAQIAAQTAAVTVDPDYARRTGVIPGAQPSQIVGTLLYCGVYDAASLGSGGGILGWFVKSTAWAYSGKRDWHDAEGFDTMSVIPNVTGAFPPAFISAGNADPLGPQSVALADALAASGVKVERLFFPEGYRPPLGHEYQFDLDGEAGRLALERSTAWLKGLGPASARDR